MSLNLSQKEFDQGQLAVKRFKKLIAIRYRPLLRAVTKNDQLQVEPHGSQAFTDGKTVWLPVPLVLGDETLEHNKSLCGTRHATTLAMLCPMCEAEDQTDGLIFHESAHLTEGSFNHLPYKRAIALIKDLYSDHLANMQQADIDDLFKRITKVPNESSMATASLLDSWLPFALNAVEDVYVNRRLFHYRKGAEVPLRVFSRKIVEEGIQSVNSSSQRINEADKSVQALMSAYYIGSELDDFGQYLDPEHDLTSDPELIAIMDKIPGDCEVEDRFAIALELVSYLRTKGYCPQSVKDAMQQLKPPATPPMKDEADEPEPGQTDDEDSGSDDEAGDSDESAQPGENGDGESEDGEDDEADPLPGGQGEADESDDEDADDFDDQQAASGGSDEDDSDDSQESESSNGDSDEESEEDTESDPSGASDDGDDDDDGLEPEDASDQPSEEEIQDALEQASELLEKMMGHDAEGPEMTNTGLEAELLDQVLNQEDFDAPSQVIGKYKLVSADEAQTATYGSGHVDFVPRSTLTPSLSRLRVVFASNRKTGMERSLKRGSRLDTMHLYRAGTDDPRFFGKRNIPKSRDWFVCVGLDMSGSAANNGAEQANKSAGHAIGELLHMLGIRFAMYAHSSTYDMNSYSSYDLTHWEVKSPDANWKDRKTQFALANLDAGGCNVDGHSLEQYRKVMQSQKATDKLMMYFTDGVMPDYNYHEELELLKRNIELMKRDRVKLLGIGYRTDSPKAHGLDTIQFDSPNDIKSIVDGLEARLVR